MDVDKTINRANNKFSQRIKKVKELTNAQGLLNLHEQSVNVKLNIWKQATQINILPASNDEKGSGILAYEELNKEAVQFGFNWPNIQMTIEKILTQVQRVQESFENQESFNYLQEKVGGFMQATFALCLFCNFNIKETLKKANSKFETRLKNLKKLAYAHGLPNLRDQSISYKLELWDKAKKIS